MLRNRRSAFTLIELLVVIGVILLLIGIGVVAFQKLDKVIGERSTTARLQSCASMLSEYEVAAQLTAIEGSPPVAAYRQGTAIAIGDVTVGSPARTQTLTPNPNYPPVPPTPTPLIPNPTYPTPNPVEGTGWVFWRMLRIPAVKTMVGQLPTGALMTVHSARSDGVMVDGPWLSPPPTPVALAGPPFTIVLDAWKNPIIFVPTGGLYTWAGGKIPFHGETTDATGGPWAHVVRVVSVDSRPFWASAGQDGRFDTADDNLYSCPVMFVKP